MAIDQHALERSPLLKATEAALTAVRALFAYDRLMAALPEGRRAAAGELYVVAHFVGFSVFFAAAPFGAPAWVFYLFTALGVYRLLDIYSHHLRWALVDVWRTGYAGTESIRRRVLLAAVNFAELIVIFAVILRTTERAVEAAAFAPVLGGKSEALALAVSTATTAGFSQAAPVALAARAALVSEVVLSVLLLAIVLALTVQAVRTVGGRGRD